MSKVYPHSPSLRRRRLSAELRKARARKQLTTAQAAQSLNWATGKLNMIENAETKSVKPGDLDKLLDLYAVTDESTREVLHHLARDAKVRGWWSRYKEVFGDQALPDFEAEASTIRTFEALTIPGLLQTPEYAEAIFRGGRYVSPDEIARRVEFRLSRREILTKYPPAQLRVVLDEAALRRIIGTKRIMIDQLRYLLHMAQLPNVDVQVVPFDSGAHAALSVPFTILEFADPTDSPIAFVDTVTTGLFLEDVEDIQLHSSTFGDVQGSALNTVRSASFIENVMASLESEQ